MQLEEGIARQYASDDIPRLSEDNLCELNDRDFAIWPENKVKQQPLGSESTEPGEITLKKLALVPEFPITQKEELFHI